MNTSELPPGSILLFVDSSRVEDATNKAIKSFRLFEVVTVLQTISQRESILQTIMSASGRIRVIRYLKDSRFDTNKGMSLGMLYTLV